MKLLMQGMRRSGTTVVYDVLSQDGRLDLYYEPLGLHGNVSVGGGSGLQDVDHKARIHRLRDDFVADNPGYRIEPADLNYGAPRDPLLELETGMARWAREYLSRMLDHGEHVAAKFTRAYRKMGVLAGIAPDAEVALLVRHPQQVVASYLYGRDQKWTDLVPDGDTFFTRTSASNPWNARRLFEGIVAAEGWDHLTGCPDWMLVLAVWRYTFDYSYTEAAEAFGRPPLIVRHEDLVADPAAAVGALYGRMGLEVPPPAVAWARANLRRIRRESYPDDPRWQEGYERVGLDASLQTVGYRREGPGAGGQA